MIKKLLASALCMALASCAQASSWHFIDGSDSEAMAIDTDSIETTGNIKGAWTLLVHNIRQDDNAETYVIGWIELDCKKKMIRTQESASYTPHGDTVRSWRGEYLWSRIYPGSFGSRIFKCICKKDRGALVSKDESSINAAYDLGLFMIINKYWEPDPFLSKHSEESKKKTQKGATF